MSTADAGIACERHVAAVDDFAVEGIACPSIGDCLDNAEVGELASAGVAQDGDFDLAVGRVVAVATFDVQLALEVYGTGVVARSTVGNRERDILVACYLISGEDDEASGWCRMLLTPGTCPGQMRQPE